MTRWFPQGKTLHGSVHPPLDRSTSTRYGQASTASRRYQDRVHDKLAESGSVQLAPGVLIIYDRKPWRVLEVTERPDDLWGARLEERWRWAVESWERNPQGERPERATWRARPFAIALVPDRQPNAKPVHLAAPGDHRWDVLPEHYSICIACGELPPCRHAEADWEATQQMARASVLMDIPVGACLGCGEAITGRQKAQRYPGPNLWRPDLSDGSAVFHARQECVGDADRYAEQWRARGGQNPEPSLFTDQPDGGQS